MNKSKLLEIFSLKSPSSPANLSLARFALNQSLFFVLLPLSLLNNIFLSIYHKTFSYRAFFKGLLSMFVGLGGLSVLIYHNYQQAVVTDTQQNNLLYLALLLLMTATGLYIQATPTTSSNNFKLSEIFLAWLSVSILSYLQLAYGVDYLLSSLQMLGGLKQELIPHELILPRLSPGVLYLGNLWDRLFILGALLSLLMLLFGASLTLIFKPNSLDLHSEMEWFIAYRQLKEHKQGFLFSLTALIAITGIALGVATLLTVNAIMSGYQTNIENKILATNAHLVIQKYGVDFAEYPAIQQKIANIEGIVASNAFVFGEALLSYKDVGLGILLKGIEPLNAAKVTSLGRNLCEKIVDNRCLPYADEAAGSKALAKLLDPQNLDPLKPVQNILIGLELFKKLHKQIGDVLTITTPISLNGKQIEAPKRLYLRLAGVFHTGFYDFDVKLTYVHLEVAQRLMNMPHTVNGLELRLTDAHKAKAFSKKISNVIGSYPYHLLEWQDLNNNLFAAIKLQKIVMFLVLTFIIIVASFNIASTLFMAVVEKASEIALLKALGARDNAIMKIFMLQGWLIGASGLILGLLLGFGLTTLLSTLNLQIAGDIYMVDSLKVHLNSGDILVTALATLLIAHLATLYPALKAAKEPLLSAIQ